MATVAPPRPTAPGAPSPAPGGPGPRRKRRRAVWLIPPVLMLLCLAPIVLIAGAGNPPNSCDPGAGTSGSTDTTGSGYLQVSGPHWAEELNRIFAEHQSPDYSGVKLTPDVIAALAESAGRTVGKSVPGWTMQQVTIGESSGRPGSSSTDNDSGYVPGTSDPTKGWGLWAITWPYYNRQVAALAGGSDADPYSVTASPPYPGYEQMLNPVKNAIVMAEAYEPSLTPWHGREYVTDFDKHYAGPLPIVNLYQVLGIKPGNPTATIGTPAKPTSTAGTSTTTADPGATSTSTGVTVDAQAANTAAAKAPSGEQVGWAVVTPAGQVLGQRNGSMPVYGASITKAMLLVAEMEKLGTEKVPASEQQILAPMIEASANGPGSEVFSQVGAAGVQKVAHQAGMTGFQLNDTDDSLYTLGQSKVTALDQARLFAQVDQLIPPTNRSYAMGLLTSISAADHWGILSAPLPGATTTASKAGWKAETPVPDGPWGTGVVNQAAQLSVGGTTVGMAVTTTGDPSQADGESMLQSVATALAPTGGTSSSSESCSGDPGADLPLQLTPGQTARIDPKTGIASAPESAPKAVQQAIAAGNQLIDKPYVWGGGHADLNQLADGYDCSSSSEYVLHQAGLYAPSAGPASSAMEHVFKPGPGKWITVYADDKHMWLVVAGVMFSMTSLLTTVFRWTATGMEHSWLRRSQRRRITRSG